MLLAPLLKELLGLTAGELLWSFGRGERLAQNGFESNRIRDKPRLELLNGDGDDGLDGNAFDSGVEQLLPRHSAVGIDENHGEIRLPIRISPEQKRTKSRGAVKDASAGQLSAPGAKRFLEAYERGIEIRTRSRHRRTSR